MPADQRPRQTDPQPARFFRAVRSWSLRLSDLTWVNGKSAW